MTRKYRLAVINTHPIQYFAPLYRRLAQESDLDLMVYYCSNIGAEAYVDPGFGQQLKWDIPLLDGYDYKILKNLRSTSYAAGFWGLINPSIVTELWRGHYDALLVHGHTPFSNLLAIIAAKLSGTSVFMRGETHLLLERKGLRKRLHPVLMKWFYKLCDAFLAIGSLNREFYLAHDVPPEKVFLVPYSVDNQFFMSRVDAYKDKRSEIRAELGLPAETPVILYASKLQRRKHPVDLLLAYQQLREHGVPACLAYVGSGEEEATLKELAAAQNIKDVSFYGFRNQSELPKFFAAADVFALPSENEPWGLIVNEAMCASLPIVVGEKVGAVRDLLQINQNGFTCKPGDVQELSRCLTQVVSQPAQMSAMGQRSREIINNWGYEQCVQGIKAALHHVTRA